jgi:hypothetical protein
MTSDRRYPGEPRFPDLAMIGRIETEVEQGGKIVCRTRYYVCSTRLGAEMFDRVVRGRWRIENRLYWMLDVVFREDLTRLRSGNAPGGCWLNRTFGSVASVMGLWSPSSECIQSPVSCFCPWSA